MNVAELTGFVERDPALCQIAREVSLRLADDPAHDLAHCLRVASWTVRFAAGGVEPRLSIAAALLHDVVNVPKNSAERTRASEASAAYARERLSALGFDASETALVCDAIRDHSFSRGATPETLLGKALQDADRLEALGAIGLIRCLLTGARMNAQPFDPLDPFAENRALDDKRWSVDHLFTKLLALPDTMQTEPGRAEAKRRARLLHEFVAALAHELERDPVRP